MTRPRPAHAPQFFWVEVALSPVIDPDQSDVAHEVVALLRDVTDRKDQENRMRDARQLAEDASNAKSRFLATIGHELRTPLNAIVGFSEMMTSGVVGELIPVHKEYASLIHQSGHHLLDVVKMLLDMSRIEAGKFELQTESFSPDSLGRAQSLRMVDKMARDKQVRLVTELPRVVPMLTADERACLQILINLLSNAIKFSREHGVVTLSMKRQGRYLNISVSDHGIGMDPKTVDRIGEPFFQAQDGLSRGYDGTGLGLSIVKGLIDLHEGSLHAVSEPGIGTTMTVLLPLNGPAIKLEESASVTPLHRDTCPAANAPMARRKKKSSMTAALFTTLPLQAGIALAVAAGRALSWAFGLFMLAPLRNTGMAALVGFAAIAGSNALYFQKHHHPSPLFGEPVAETASVADPVPVAPAIRHKYEAVEFPLDDAATGSVARPDESPKTVGNADVFEVQRKLQAFKLFSDTVDGYFGPHTARAIKAFEQRLGRRQTGQLTPEIIELIKSTPIIEPPPVVEPITAPEPLPKQAATREATALPAPEPLPMTVESKKMEPVGEPKVAEAESTVLTRDLPTTPQDAVNIAVDVAGDAINSIIAGVQTMAMTKPNIANTGPAEQATAQAASAQPAPEVLTSDTSASATALRSTSTDTDTVSKVQRGLASLGFLHGTIDGVAGEATAKAIRNFEVYYNYNVTGRISPELVNLLVQNGAVI